MRMLLKGTSKGPTALEKKSWDQLFGNQRCVKAKLTVTARQSVLHDFSRRNEAIQHQKMHSRFIY